MDLILNLNRCNSIRNVETATQQLVSQHLIQLYILYSWNTQSRKFVSAYECEFALWSDVYQSVDSINPIDCNLIAPVNSNLQRDERNTSSIAIIEGREITEYFFLLQFRQIY